ncbi:SMEK domain-containing protein [Aliarcobacter butzleri]|uniref:SMEK domain-containing protein n=1 Tax=Aliarcobacter butzleri TaxID=28197 RepID=UPI001EDA9F4B|nr:SMEK domain-containing protein [Aliarcobacter butzleri]MCG3693324.1 SMEK domain-containing protein [Aliarcobacter butzleri]
MYKRKDIIEEIIYALNLIKLNIKSFSKLSLYDLNIYSEDFFCKLLNIINDFNLKNLNIKDKNSVAIDLADLEQSICYQVTSDSSSSKIKNTIQKFEKYKLYHTYKKLFILVINDKKTYRTTFKTNGEYQFKNNQILDLNDLIEIIKSLDHEKILNTYEFIKKNIIIFQSLSLKNNKNGLRTDISNILLDIKEDAIEKYNINEESVKGVLACLKSKNYGNYEISEENLRFIYNINLLFQSISENKLEELSYLIKIYPDEIKYAVWKFDHYYKRKDRIEIDDYLFENILRILNNLYTILQSDINLSYSSFNGNYDDLVSKKNILASISNEKKNDHKIIFLDNSKDINLGYRFSLGGISEKVENLKQIILNNEKYILANSKKNIYLWNINQPNLNPIKINKDDYLILDYEVFEKDKTLHIIAITECNNILVWKIIEHIVLNISILSLENNAYVIVNQKGRNKLINNWRYSKSIYKYNIETNTIDAKYTIPREYHKIARLAIHPTKSQIAFSFCIPDTSDPFELECRVFEFENIAIFDLEKEIEIFREQIKGHYLYKIEYFEEKENVYLIVYDPDGCGHNFQPLIKKWKENSNRYVLDYIYDSYSIEKNHLLNNLKLVGNQIFFDIYDEDTEYKVIDKIIKISNNKEKCFYKLNEGYVVNDLAELNLE